MTTDWNPLLRGEFEKPYWHELQRFVADERARVTVYPEHDEVFAALHHTPFASQFQPRAGNAEGYSCLETQPHATLPAS